MKKIYISIKNNWGLLLILILASILRLIALHEYPKGTYTDEAYGAYIANGLLTAGIDDRGCHYPIYFIAWGSGMNALYLYLGMLFFKLFGVSLAVYRLPQALFGILSIGAFYIIGKELYHKKAGLFLAFVLTVNPWHIMMCRFGLESNLAPNMFLIALMFLILGLKRKNGYLIPAAILFGLTLYCYAITWLVMPIFFVFSILICRKWIPAKKISFTFILILFFLSLPLLTFLAINYDLIPEIRSSFITIPKLTGFRSGELSPLNIKNSTKNLLTIILWEQGDRSELLSNITTGCYYFFTTPFMIFGVIYHICGLFRHFKNGKNDLSYLFLSWLISAGLICMATEDLTMIHINMIHIPVIFYGAYGIYSLAKLCKTNLLLYCCTAFYALSLTFFVNSYLHMDFSSFYDERPYEAVVRAKEIAGENGSITFFGYSIYKFPNLLWREKCDIINYSQYAVYDGNPFFAELQTYRNYHFINDKTECIDTTKTDVYILHNSRIGEFHDLGFQVEQVNDMYAVAAMQIPSK